MRTTLCTATLLTLPIALGLTSCAAQKTLTITSEPPGASVRLGDNYIGETPVTVKFLHYGTQRLGLALTGYDRVERDMRISPPWYARFPIDFFSEVLLPIGWTDHRLVSLKLEPTPERIDAVELDFVRLRAEHFRNAGGIAPEDLPSRPAEQTGRIEAGPLRQR
ncbi:MAG: PEGA domain-containing protein [Planctomycetota bacterium]|nr:PEGA domain-containing protein [Planctomycetota bacterium]MDG2141939.1 PEGA domain-containing protein [Planctomycetota bacterium]